MPACDVDRGHGRLLEREQQPARARVGQRGEREHRRARAGGGHTGRVTLAERGGVLGREPDRGDGLPRDARIGERRAHAALAHESRVVVVVHLAVARPGPHRQAAQDAGDRREREAVAVG